MDVPWEVENLKWELSDLKRRLERLESEFVNMSELDEILEAMNEYIHATIEEHNHNSHRQGE